MLSTPVFVFLDIFFLTNDTLESDPLAEIFFGGDLEAEVPILCHESMGPFSVLSTEAARRRAYLWIEEIIISCASEESMWIFKRLLMIELTSSDLMGKGS